MAAVINCPDGWKDGRRALDGWDIEAIQSTFICRLCAMHSLP